MSYRILLTILFLTFSFAQDDCDGNFVDCLLSSSEQAAYYFSAITLDGETLTSTDVIIAKNEESISQTAIRFALDNDAISSVLVGFSKENQIDEITNCSDKPSISEGTMRSLRNLWDSDFQ